MIGGICDKQVSVLVRGDAFGLKQQSAGRGAVIAHPTAPCHSVDDVVRASQRCGMR
jgi:hypothetical protein